ncbi:MAG: hypothetical protein FK733_08715 [Asgard group archaeon]|nr:hypothetical protein [Asgard group archaeon]
MNSEANNTSDNFIRLSKDALEELLDPIPKDVLMEKVAQIKEWKSKRESFKDGQNKQEYFIQHLGRNLTLSDVRDLRTIKEHYSLPSYNWLLFNWDKSIARFYPDKIKEKFENVFKNIDSMVNVDFLVADEESQTLYVLLELWRKETIINTYLTRIETEVPKYFRMYISIKNKFLLVQEKSPEATKEVIKIFKKAFAVKTEEVRINAMIIREFVKANPRKLTKLVVKVPQEVAGFAGLTELSFSGSDVIQGSKGMMDRHETTPINVGPWTGVSNKNLELNVGKAINAKSIDDVLTLIELIKEIM